MDSVAIIADDLTGASDTGVKLSKRGYETDVVFNPNDIHVLMGNDKILSINSSTREKHPDDAYEAVFGITHMLKENGYNKIYKKIDSVLRGNVTIEIEAVMEALNINMAFLVPAIPSNDRLVIDGYLYADKKKEPNLDIPDVLKNFSKCRIETITIDEIRNDKVLPAKLYEISSDKKVIVLFDTEKDEDLKIIANILRGYKENFVLAGASGISMYLPEIWNLRSSVDVDVTINKIGKLKSNLVIAGSFHSSTSLQIKKLIEEFHCQLFIIDTEKVIKGEIDSNSINYELDNINNNEVKPEIIVVAVDTLLNSDIIPSIDNGELIGDFISRLVSRIIKSGHCKTMTITGGETAHHVMRHLGALGMRLKDEIITGLPVGTVIGGIANDMPLVTKSGGFGEPTALIEVIKYLSEEGEEVKINAV